MDFEYITDPNYFWINFYDLPIETQIHLLEEQYRKQLKIIHSYTLEDKR